MCVPNFIQIQQFSGETWLQGEKWSNQKAQISRDARHTLLPMKKSWVKGNVGSWDFTCSLVNYLHYVCYKIHPNQTTFSLEGLTRKKWWNQKAQNSRDAPTFLLRMTEYRVRGSLRNRNLHVVSQLLLLCVCQISSKSNKFQGKRG